AKAAWIVFTERATEQIIRQPMKKDCSEPEESSDDAQCFHARISNAASPRVNPENADSRNKNPIGAWLSRVAEAGVRGKCPPARPPTRSTRCCRASGPLSRA